jgi:transforming growth factor-beta-induced protein
MNNVLNTIAAASVLVGLSYAQCGGCSESKTTEVVSGDKNIVEVAVEAGKFNTLAKALTEAGLVSALQGEGPFTVFAPIDSAFAQIPADKLASLLKPENRKKLTSILTYHVVPGRLMAKDVLAKGKLTTLQGGKLEVRVDDDGARIGNAKILKTDVLASNGVIHVIDSVLMPKSKKAKPSIVGVAKKAGKFNTLLAAAKAAGLASVLDQKGPFTIFAPTDAAFAKVGDKTIASLLEPQNKAKLQAILKLHVVSGKVKARDAVIAGEAKTLNGQMVEFGIDNGRLTVNGAQIIGTDVYANNGVVHIIDTVLLPR